MNFDRSFLIWALSYAAVGLALGIYMAASQNHGGAGHACSHTADRFRAFLGLRDHSQVVAGETKSRGFDCPIRSASGSCCYALRGLVPGLRKHGVGDNSESDPWRRFGRRAAGDATHAVYGYEIRKRQGPCLRLSERTSRLDPRRAVPKRCQAYETVRECIQDHNL